MSFSLACLYNGQQFFTDAGIVLSGGKINTYLAGTSTPTATYTDSTGITPNANPIILLSNGRCAQEIWVPSGGLYKFVLTDPNNNILQTLDNIPGVNDVNALNVFYTGPFGGSESISAAIAVLPGHNYISNASFDAALVPSGALSVQGVNAVPTVLDYWLTTQNTASAGIAAQVACADITGFAKYLKIGRNNGSASVNSILLAQAIRTVDSIPLQGKNVILSFYMKAGTNYSGGQVNVVLFGGTGIDEGVASMGGWTGVTTPIGTNQTITTSPVLYTFTGTIPTNITEIGVRIFYTPTGTAGADDNIYTTGWKVEIGTVVTARENAPFVQFITAFRPETVCGGVMSNFGGSDPFSQAQFLAKVGNTVLIDGVKQIIPSGNISSAGGITATYSSCSVDKVLATSLVSGNLYFIYVYMLAGQLTLDFSLTAYITHPVYGNPVKSSDFLCSLVGLCFIQNTYTYTLTGGAGYATPGRYRSVVLTGGTGSGATADITVAGGAVTIVNINKLSSVGTKYTNGDSLTTSNANLGGSGAGFSITIGNSALTTMGGARGQTITSYYNRFVQRLETGISASTTATTNTFAAGRLDDGGIAQLSNGERAYNMLEWVQWFDQAPLVEGMANMGHTVAGTGVNLSSSISDGLGANDAINGFQAFMLATSGTPTSVQLSTQNDPHDATGYYRAWAMGWGAAAGTTSLAGLMFANGVTS